MISQVFLVRHGDTSWSKSGRHTGRTEVPLSEEGERNALMLSPRLAGIRFNQVLVSPRERARRTCVLAGLGDLALTDPDLVEWDYGDYEGLRSAEILKERPDWNLFRDGCPGGESAPEVSARADRLVARIRTMDGKIALFSHGHFCRVLGARWAGLSVINGERLLVDPASVSTLAYEHENPAAPVLALWNDCPARALGER